VELFSGIDRWTNEKYKPGEVTVRNGTHDGVFISGASNVILDHVDLNENGLTVPPGARLNHNLLLTHCSNVTIKDSRMATSPLGTGISLEHCSDVTITNCEINRNGFFGIMVAESRNISITNNLIEGNDRSGILVEFQQNGCDKVSLTNNLIHYNNGYGVESYACKNFKNEKNKYAGNGSDKAQEKVSAEKTIFMQ
jgi:parallel beta-helix repeat protein